MTIGNSPRLLLFVLCKPSLANFSCCTHNNFNWFRDSLGLGPLPWPASLCPRQLFTQLGYCPRTLALTLYDRSEALWTGLRTFILHMFIVKQLSLCFVLKLSLHLHNRAFNGILFANAFPEIMLYSLEIIQIFLMVGDWTWCLAYEKKVCHVDIHYVNTHE